MVGPATTPFVRADISTLNSPVKFDDQTLKRWRSDSHTDTPTNLAQDFQTHRRGIK